ncbi:alpha/beta hydrolase [Streptomyces sp. NBC_01294]|uniref:alpha/beta hydrolase n=1 Tax=Streptomyces sp. NBC_01294 TaxID=2903815 RepID=UPI002DDBE6AD|nr:alpha/beta hydrolase [Streptomyces sp. NBC_01294]WRZ60748.1 alpha/beta hydrolase [Streptomyces sp. NBC_01294]
MAAGTVLALLSAAGVASAGGPGGGDSGDGLVLRWRPCTQPAQAGFECAVAKVPLDHAAPSGRTIDLALIRHAAADRGRRAGSLFFNPGGPGGPGTVGLPELYGKFPQELKDRFDIVSWDPRGVGESTAVRCFDTAGEAAAWHEGVPPFPVGPQEQRAYVAAYADLAQRCERRDPQLLRHISTADTARDLDLLRRAVGEERLRYWGISYGTLLGATYANLFPDRVGRLVVDGNVDPRAWVNRGAGGEPGLNTFLRLGSHLGSAATLAQFLDLCGRAPVSGCPFSAGSPAATRAKYDALLARLAKEPVGTWTYARAVGEVRGGLYSVHPGWSGTADTLQSLWQGRAPDESPAPSGSARYPGFEQSLAVMCAESPNPASPGHYAGLEDLAVRQAGALGRWWAWANEPCAAWPARAADPYAGPWNRTPAHPVLVVNAVYDPSTPYRAGQAMAAELAGARLLTLDGHGHTALDNPSTCVKRHVVRYVLTGALPPEGARCGQDVPPFTTAGKPSSRAASPRPDGTDGTGRTGGTGGTWSTGGRPAGPFTPWPLRPPGLFPDRPGWIAVVLPGMTDAAVSEGVGKEGVGKEDVRSVRRAR